MDVLALLLVLAFYLAFASQGFTERLRRLFPGTPRKLCLAMVLLLPYLMARLPAPVTAELVREVAFLALYLLLPVLLLLMRKAPARPLDALDLVALLLLWLPFELGWLPAVKVALAPGMKLPLVQFIALGQALLLYRIVRPLELGFDFRLSRADLRLALAATAAFLALALPLGLWLDFIKVAPAPLNAVTLLAVPIGGYFLVALPEELLFRGIIQNLLERRLGRGLAPLLATAAIFGLAHLNNFSPHHAPPNWHYAFMAALAGIAYGWVWQRTGKVTAAAITHVLVNWGWLALFRG